MPVLTIPRDRIAAQVRPGDRITAIDGRPLPQARTVKAPDGAAVLLVNHLGGDTEHRLYPDTQVLENVTVERPVRVTGRGYKYPGDAARAWGIARGLYATGGGSLYAQDRKAYDALPSFVRDRGRHLPVWDNRVSPLALLEPNGRGRARQLIGWGALYNVLQWNGVVVEHEGRWYIADEAGQ